MKNIVLFFRLLPFLLFVGCANPYGLKKTPEIKNFVLNVTSEPSDAKLVWSKKGVSHDLRVTPAALHFQFEKRRGDDFLGQVGIPTWQPTIPSYQPWRVVETETHYEFSLIDIQLVRSGFEPQPFTYTWRVPKDFKARDEFGLVVGDIPMSAQLHVVLENPTLPQVSQTLTVDVAQGPAKLYAFNPENPGQPGKFLGTTPMQFTIGSAPIRSAAGEIIGWKRWADDPNGLWSHTKDGIVRLNAVLELDGYERETLVYHPVMVLKEGAGQDRRAVVRMTTPSRPLHNFVLSLDSLPSQATVYLLADDGTLGQAIGKAPSKITFGFAQKIVWNPEAGTYVHGEWLMWDTTGLLRVEAKPDGTSIYSLNCAMYLDGFATKYLKQPIFELAPGKPFPQNRVMNVPLLKPEQAAAMEVHERLNRPQVLPTPVPPIRERPRTFIWKGPEGTEQE